MLIKLLEPIVKYVEAAAHLAAIQVTTPRDQSRIASAGRAANAALAELTQALMSADLEHIGKDVSDQQATIEVISRKLVATLQDTRFANTPE